MPARKKVSGDTNLALLELNNLHVALEDGTGIVKGVDLAVNTDEVHAIMGPNGSGKSTLAYALMGHPAYEITEGEILFEGETVTELGADERAQRGLFLAFQYPHAVPGVTVTSFLRSALNSIRKARAGGREDPVPVPQFRKDLLATMERLRVPREMAQRYLNEGFSGGEKKRVEILQMAMLKPRIAILDETDSGLDIDALKIVAAGVKELVGPEMGAVVITHYQRILNYIEPDHVHVFVDGRIVESGGPELAHRLEAEGYEAFAPAQVGGEV
jgi:Fe-S cluster assembly ATP-binding protein